MNMPALGSMTTADEGILKQMGDDSRDYPPSKNLEP